MKLIDWTDAITAARDRIYGDLEGKSARNYMRHSSACFPNYETGFSEACSLDTGPKVEDPEAKDRLQEFLNLVFFVHLI